MNETQSQPMIYLGLNQSQGEAGLFSCLGQGHSS